jgi:hypothetical protein
MCGGDLRNRSFNSDVFQRHFSFHFLRALSFLSCRVGIGWVVGMQCACAWKREREKERVGLEMGGCRIYIDR